MGASYSSLCMFYFERLEGLGCIDDSHFAGSAHQYFPADYKGNPNALDYVYALKLSRNCKGEEHCFDIPDGTKDLSRRTVMTMPMDGHFLVMQRDYLNRKTGVGPSYLETINPSLYHKLPNPNPNRP